MDDLTSEWTLTTRFPLFSSQGQLKLISPDVCFQPSKASAFLGCPSLQAATPSPPPPPAYSDGCLEERSCEDMMKLGYNHTHAVTYIFISCDDIICTVWWCHSAYVIIWDYYDSLWMSSAATNIPKARRPCFYSSSELFRTEQGIAELVAVLSLLFGFCVKGFVGLLVFWFGADLCVLLNNLLLFHKSPDESPNRRALYL